MTLREFAQQIGMTDEQVMNTPIKSFEMNADVLEKIMTLNNLPSRGFKEFYTASRTYSLGLSITQRFPPQFYGQEDQP